MSDEDAFQAAIDADPLDKLPRLVFCDWLDERSDPRAEGMRVLAEFDRWPLQQCNTVYGFGWWNYTVKLEAGKIRPVLIELNLGVDRSQLPTVWLLKLKQRPEHSYHHDHYPTRREAHDTAAWAWTVMTAKEKAEALQMLPEIIKL